MDNYGQTTQQATVLYHDSEAAHLTERLGWGFAHPVSGDELARIRAKAAKKRGGKK